MGKRTLKQRLDSYADFYDRAFSTVDVESILEEGGSESLETFKEKSKGKTPKDFHDVMFNRKKVKQRDSLGQEIWARFFRNEHITKNRIGRIIVRTGESFKFKGKIYKGGQFVPKAFLARRTN